LYKILRSFLERTAVIGRDRAGSDGASTVGLFPPDDSSTALYLIPVFRCFGQLLTDAF
jgi:hypothetical protein